mmetsp:Transcript_22128/g.54740  ORF Transcript_22128/g.54740 Transcript_22128/m.54740 type:complete len:92 (-) Transcript_22128:82-357(-)
MLFFHDELYVVKKSEGPAVEEGVFFGWRKQTPEDEKFWRVYLTPVISSSSGEDSGELRAMIIDSDDSGGGFVPRSCAAASSSDVLIGERQR